MIKFILFIIFLCIYLSKGLDRNIFVDVKSNWKNFISSSIVEIGEYLKELDDSYSENHNSLYRGYVNKLCENETSTIISNYLVASTSDSNAESDLQSYLLSLTEMILPESLQTLLELSLNLGVYLPTVQFYESVSESDAKYNKITQNGFVVVHDKVLFSFDELQNFLSYFSHSESISYKQNIWDIEFSSSNRNPDLNLTIPLFLYGIPGERSFCEIHNQLTRSELYSQIQYIIKYKNIPSYCISNNRNLQGFGVLLDIKNMEYKAFDSTSDSKNNSNSSNDNLGSAVTPETETEILGFNVNKITKLLSLSDENVEKIDKMKIFEEKLLDLERKKSAKNSFKTSDELKVWQMKDLGLQTVKYINDIATLENNDVEKSINTLIDIVYNFPIYASKLSLINIENYQSIYSAGWYSSGLMNTIQSNSIYINGIRIDLSSASFNVFEIIKVIQLELISINKLNELKLSEEIKSSIQKLLIQLYSKTERSAGITRIDISKGAKHNVHFINNLEKDAMYKRWPKSVKQLLYPSWSMHTIAKNLYTLVAIVDPLSKDGALLLNEISQMYGQMYPIRFGLTLWCQDNDDDQNENISSERYIAKPSDVCILFHLLKESKGQNTATDFLLRVAEQVLSQLPDSTFASNQFHGEVEDSDTLDLKVSMSIDELMSLYKATTNSHNANDIRLVLLSENHSMELSYNQYLQNTTEYVTSRGMRKNTYTFNGIYVPSSDISGSLMNLLGREQYLLAQLVGTGALTDKIQSIFAFILNQFECYSRYHPLIDEKEPAYTPSLNELNSVLLPYTDFHESSSYENTTILVLTLDKFGFLSAKNFLEWLLTGTSTVSAEFIGKQRVKVIFNYYPNTASYIESDGLTTLESDPLFKTIKLLEKLFSDGSTKGYLSNDNIDKVKSIHEVFTIISDAKNIDDVLSFLTGVVYFEELDKVDDFRKQIKGLRNLLNIQEGEIAVIYNSRKVIISKEDKYLRSQDMSLLSSIEYKRLGNTIENAIKSSNSLDISSEKLWIIYSFIGNYQQNSKYSRIDIETSLEEAKLLPEGNSINPVLNVGDEDIMLSGVNYLNYPFMFHLNSPSRNSDLKVYFIFDPLTLSGQRAASLFYLINKHLNVDITIYLTPQLDIGVFPLQNFYRFVSPSIYQPNYLSNDNVIIDSNENNAKFFELPKQHTLTVRIDSPEAWNIQAIRAIQDIDNLRCEPTQCGDRSTNLTRVSYVLKSLLVTGQCYDYSPHLSYPNPPNGLQLTLSNYILNNQNDQNISYADTLVMQNLGYFQLQGGLGVWTLQLAQGRASKLYTIISNEDSSKTLKDGITVTIKNFHDNIFRLKVRKRAGYEKTSLLDESGDEKYDYTTNYMDAIWNQFSSIFTTSNKTGSSNSKELASYLSDDNKIHIFSLATGHMYERLLRIMMLSVSRKTSVTVKFWLFENFLSPTFKETAAIMSEIYGFEVAYVTYKWPEWLTHQTEKQRIIWGYKILFLDVLFPLHIKKIIYVDADQVIRSDLKELWDLDLQGAPYGYVPFCTSRQETLGFQFWSSGYWKEHLRGKKYHISALYVVDLQVFRRFAIGDKLRSIYDGLARDPNSLANLDQDLPNYAQHQVPIFSLPQEWLWCETWCSDESKSKAKTIDLCNNPLHKEPKLDMAKRIISGSLFNESWIELDEEISNLIQKYHHFAN